MLRPIPWWRIADAIHLESFAVQMQIWWVLCLSFAVVMVLVPCVGMVGWRGVRPALLPILVVVVGGSFGVRYLVALQGL